MRDVTVYTTDHCARCVGAKTLLTKRGIGYQEINLAKDPDGRAELMRRTGMFTFPQIVIGDETLGGFDELLAADREGRLTSCRASALSRASRPFRPLRRAARGRGWQCSQT